MLVVDECTRRRDELLLTMLTTLASRVPLPVAFSLCLFFTIGTILVVYHNQSNEAELILDLSQKKGESKRTVVIKERIENYQWFIGNSTDVSEVGKPYLNLRKPVYNHRPPQSEFQWLFKDNTTLVYSAHYDNRDDVIKIVGFKHRFAQQHENDSIFCQFADNTVTPMTTFYNVSTKKPRPGLEYNTWVWVCECQRHTPPRYISIVSQSKEVLVERISVSYYTFPDGMEKDRRPVICVKPMVHNYDDSYQLREFLEVSRLWGAAKVVLYPFFINETVIRPILKEYDGFIDIHEWKPPVHYKKLHAFGQKSHNQHCLYTYMYRYQWAAFIDLDELIVPGIGLKSIELMLQAGTRAITNITILTNAAGFVLRSQLCSISLPDDPIYRKGGGMMPCLLTSMRKTNCTQPMQIGVWSKPIVNTDGTEIVDIHTIPLPRPSYTVVDLDPNIGVVHHYRALGRTSPILKQSSALNVRKRNTHMYMSKAMEVLANMCTYNNPSIGSLRYG